MYVLAVGPMPFYLAQLVPTLGWSAADVMSINGCGISLFKMLFVSHFDLIFSQDPELLGQLVLGLNILLGCAVSLTVSSVSTTLPRE